jgi:hypothetical protein
MPFFSRPFVTICNRSERDSYPGPLLGLYGVRREGRRVGFVGGRLVRCAVAAVTVAVIEIAGCGGASATLAVSDQSPSTATAGAARAGRLAADAVRATIGVLAVDRMGTHIDDSTRTPAAMVNRSVGMRTASAELDDSTTRVLPAAPS